MSSDGRVAPGSEGPQEGGGIRNGPVSGRFGPPNRNPKSEGPILNGVPILKPANKPGASATNPGGSVNSGFTGGKDPSNMPKPDAQVPKTTPKPDAQEPKTTPKPDAQTLKPGDITSLPNGTLVNGGKGVVSNGRVWAAQPPKLQDNTPRL